MKRRKRAFEIPPMPERHFRFTKNGIRVIRSSLQANVDRASITGVDMRRSIFFIFIVNAAFHFLSGCTKSPDEVARAYLTATSNSDCENAYSLLSSMDKKELSLEECKSQEVSIVHSAMSKKTKFTIKEISVKEEKAHVFIERKGPDFSKIFGEVYQKNKELDSEERDKIMVARILEENVPMKSKVEPIELVRESDGWKIFIDVKKYKEEERKREENERKEELEKLQAKAAELGIEKKLGSVNELKTAICEKLTSELPVRGRMRDASIKFNKILYDCQDPGPEKMPETGYWTKREDTSKVDNSESLFLHLVSNPDDIRSPSFIIRCKKGRTEAFISTKDFIGDSQNIVMRLDDERPRKVWVKISASNDSLFFAKVQETLKSMFGKKKLFMRYRTYSKGDKEIEFDIVGLENAIKPLKRLCKW